MISIEAKRDRLLTLLKSAVRYGRFTLASGQTSNYYIDAREVTLNGEGLYLAASLIFQRLRSRIEVVGGMSMGADPLVAGVIELAWQDGRLLDGFLVRKEAKAHGTAQRIEGSIACAHGGAEVAVLEDVTTTGRSVLDAIATIHAEYNTPVMQVIALVDRCQGAATNLVSYNFESIFTIDEILKEVPPCPSAKSVGG